MNVISVYAPAIGHHSTPWGQKWLGFLTTDPANQVMAAEAERFAGRWFRNNPSPGLLVLAGDRPVCKSKTARALWQFARTAGSFAYHQGSWHVPAPGCTYANWPEEAKRCESPGYSLPEEVVQDSLVVLDHVGRDGSLSMDGSNRLCQVLARREQKFTIITTPQPRSAWAWSFEPRVIERLQMNSVIVDVLASPEPGRLAFAS